MRGVDARKPRDAELIGVPKVREDTMAKLVRAVNMMLRERGLLKESGQDLPDLTIDDIAGYVPYVAKEHRGKRGSKSKG